MLFHYFVLFLGVCVLDCRARYSSDALGRSRIIVITDFLNSSDGDRLISSLENKDVELVFLQRDSPSSVQGSVDVLSGEEKRAFWQVTDKELLPWLLVEKPSTLISVTHSTDIPKVLISARRKGLLSFAKELVIWIIQGGVAAVSGANGIILTSPGDLDSRSSKLVDVNHLISRKVHFLYAEDFENAVVEVFQRRKLGVPRRQRRAAVATASDSSSATTSGETSTFSTVYSSIANQITVSPSMTHTTKPSKSLNFKVTSITASSTGSFGIPVQSSPSLKVTLSSSSTTAMAYSSGNAIQMTTTPNATATSSSVAALTTSFGVEVQSSFSPTVLSTSSSIAALTSFSVTSMQLTPSDTSASSLNIATLTTSSGVVVQTTSSPSVSTSTAISTSSSGIAKQTTYSPYVSAMSSSVAASMSSSGFAVQQTQSPNVNVTITSVPGSSFSPVVNTTQSEMTTTVTSPPSPSVSVLKSLSPNVSVVAQLSSSSLTSFSVVISLSSAVISTAPVLSSSSESSEVIGASSPVIVSSTAILRPSRSESMSPSVVVATSSKIASTGVSSTEIPSHTSEPLSSFTVSSSFTSTQPSQVVQSPSALVSSSKPSSISFVRSQVSTSALVVQPTPVSQLSSAVASTTLTTSLSSAAISSFTYLKPSLVSSQSAETTQTVPSLAPSSLTVVQSYISTSTSSVIRPSSSSLYSSPAAVPTETFKSSPLVSSQTTSVIATSQTSYASTSPSSSATSSPLAVATTILTTASVGISSTIRISPSSTERLPPSSSSAVVTERPPVYENETVVIVFEGDCNDITNDLKAKERFRNLVVIEVAKDLGVDKSFIHISDVQCGSILVTVTVIGTSGKANVSQELKNLVKNGNITVKFNGRTYTAKKIEQVHPSTTQPPTTKPSKNNIPFILYITFGALMALIFIVGIIVLVVRCRKDRRQGGFFLTADTNYELRRFQGIPRARNYSRVDYYGDPVELDATAADPDATSDEFQAQPDPYNKGSSLDRVKPVAAASGEEKFNVGTAGLPEWKNLPKLSKSHVARAVSPKKGLQPSSGSVGSRNELLAHEGETPQEDSKLSYDNPGVDMEDGSSSGKMDAEDKPGVSSFGDSTSGQENETQSLEKGQDNHGLTED